MDTRTIESYDLKYDGEHLIEVPGGAELYYELRGQGPQLTIINNFFIISPLWRNFTTRLVTRNRILTYDLRNQGASSAAGTRTVSDVPFTVCTVRSCPISACCPVGSAANMSTRSPGPSGGALSTVRPISD